jgi:hypothetical protein
LVWISEDRSRLEIETQKLSLSDGKLNYENGRFEEVNTQRKKEDN